MSKTRIEVFTDGVIAIVMTILVLELRQPEAGTWLDLFGVGRNLFIYTIGFIILAIYWNNHHHMFQIVQKVDGRVLWANNFFVFTLTLFPFATIWVGDFLESLAPEVTYGFVTTLANIAFLILTKELIRANGEQSQLAEIFESHRKSYFSIGLNISALILGWLIHPYFVLIGNVVVLFMWFIPDRRIEKHYNNKE